MMFMIEDETHCESAGRFGTFEDALAELRKRADVPWDMEPNRAPCVGWRTCGRTYEIVEYDDSQIPWRPLNRVRVLEISAGGVNWVALSDA
jgi:hypothetical protein